MTKQELNTLTFNEAIEKLEEENNCITDIETLKDFIIQNINDNNYYLALHIIEAIYKNDAYYYNYDYSMGCLETPTPIENLEDLEDYCE